MATTNTIFRMCIGALRNSEIGICRKAIYNWMSIDYNQTQGRMSHSIASSELNSNNIKIINFDSRSIKWRRNEVRRSRGLSPMIMLVIWAISARRWHTLYSAPIEERLNQQQPSDNSHGRDMGMAEHYSYCISCFASIHMQIGYLLEQSSVVINDHVRTVFGLIELSLRRHL